MFLCKHSLPPMAQFTLTFILFCILTFSLMSNSGLSQTTLDSAEEESVYRVLESINSDIHWRTLFPDDLCISAPHGVVCDYFSDSDSAAADNSFTTHITELSFGFVSDYSPNPPCNANSTLDPSLLSPLSHLKKLFFYKCFSQKEIPFPDFSPLSIQNSILEELVFIENPALFGSLSGKLNNLTSLRKLVLTGTNVSGTIPGEFGELVNLEQLTLSRNKFGGEISASIFKNIIKLKVLDLSENGFKGIVPESIGNMTELLKIDLSFNEFSGKIPENLKGLKNLEFLDLGYNHFANCGVPLFLGEMSSLKEVYLSGNFLGGQIPEIWERLGGILGIGLSRTGLIGNIPASMGVYLRNVCYLGLDNNKLEGIVPEAFGALEFVSELNLENNILSGRVPFSSVFASKLGKKLKLEGNSDLCVDSDSAKASSTLGKLKLCNRTEIPKFALLYRGSSCPRVHGSYALMCIGILIFLRDLF
ncbi:piriformospora indica-insensitive protein 2 [Olea europaea var. sylvestris]|uniref:piriformospora indica-insensitive protein 2 n=1 Tax=Olea europaea var. sylvestris TaxID=158386 RepID=UPI000C1D002E|nr:piriformospora indica-insensitive protein 2 [Olea europaea var. sylvestris]